VEHLQPGGTTLGLVLPPIDEPARLWEAAREAELQGFHSVWVTDSTLPGFPWLEGPSMLGGLAAVTSTIQLGTQSSSRPGAIRSCWRTR